jgi:ABC-type spermidine/putrescine transport system permease subunit I
MSTVTTVTPTPDNKVRAQTRAGAWIAMVIGALYFLLPLAATVDFSLKMRRGEYSFDAYRVVLADPHFQASFGYSIMMGVFAIVAGCADRLLGAIALAEAASADRVHHAAAAGDPGHRDRVRLSAYLQQQFVPAAHRQRARD